MEQQKQFAGGQSAVGSAVSIMVILNIQSTVPLSATHCLLLNAHCKLATALCLTFAGISY
jgi:hypothetical protein